MSSKIRISYGRIEESGIAWGPVSSSKTGIHRLTEQTEWAHCLDRAATRAQSKQSWLTASIELPSDHRANRVGSLSR